MANKQTSADHLLTSEKVPTNAQIIRDLTRAKASIQLRMISMALGLRTMNGEQS